VKKKRPFRRANHVGVATGGERRSVGDVCRHVWILGAYVLSLEEILRRAG
jgi:hypothetical protein